LVSPFGDNPECRRSRTSGIVVVRRHQYEQPGGRVAHVRTVLDIGVIIREARRDRGWTQAELARRSHVGRQWLGALEHGQHQRVELGLVLGVLAALDIELEATPETEVPGRARPGATSHGRPAAERVDLDALLRGMTVGE
jgi:transcriptional regulator with XRE-family HTH domain